MSGKIGHVKNVAEDDNGYRQFIINCLGVNDQRKYFSLSPFGIDFVAPENTRALTLESKDKDKNFSVGVLNKIKVNDLNPGESAIFSTDENGSELKSFIKFRNDGTMEFNGDVDFLVGFAKLKEGFDQLLSDFNDLVGVVNNIRSDQNTFATAYIPGSPTVQGTPPTYAITSSNGNTSSASIDDSKKPNLLCE